MARYIDADKFMEELNDAQIEFDEHYKGLGKAKVMLSLQPTADVVEVKRGHWIEDEVCVYTCSECGFTFTSADNISEFKFCRCGAKMDGKE